MTFPSRFIFVAYVLLKYLTYGSKNVFLHENRGRFKQYLLRVGSIFVASGLIPFQSMASENIPNKYYSSKYNFEVTLNGDLEKSPKLLQTHEFEIFYKSSNVNGFNVGVTVRDIY